MAVVDRVGSSASGSAPGSLWTLGVEEFRGFPRGERGGAVQEPARLRQPCPAFLTWLPLPVDVGAMLET